MEKSRSFLLSPRVLYTNVSSTFVALSVVSKPKHCLANINIRTLKSNFKMTISNSSTFRSS